jgi:hypothetical protein
MPLDTDAIIRLYTATAEDVLRFFLRRVPEPEPEPEPEAAVDLMAETFAAAGRRLTATMQLTTGRPGARACPGAYPISVRLVTGRDYSGESYGIPGQGASRVETVGRYTLRVSRPPA